MIVPEIKPESNLLLYRGQGNPNRLRLEISWVLIRILRIKHCCQVLPKAFLVNLKEKILQKSKIFCTRVISKFTVGAKRENKKLVIKTTSKIL